MVLLCQAAFAQKGPLVPCGKDPLPVYAGLDDSPIVKSWSKAEFGVTWTPPACVGWTAIGFTTLVTTGARFRSTSNSVDLLQHLGAISELEGMRYWSTTHQQWQTLIVGAHALTGSSSRRSRPDFTPSELKTGQTIYFEQEDNLAGKAIYQMHITEALADHLVFEVENVSAIRRLMVPLFHPGDLQSIYFLDRESEGIWRFYSVVRTGRNVNGLIGGNESSAINRAVAFYRYMVGIPTAQEPPAAR